MARITSGYSPAMIDQICSMALTNAHHEGLPTFTWKHLVDAMTVIESGTAINVKYTEADARAVAIHEAGHAAAAHVYVPEVESSRLSIKMRGQSLGHHQSFEKEERFGAFQSRMFGELIHAVGAMAAELVFYGENSVGVGGDLMSTTWTATGMVGAAGMSPLPTRPERQDVRGRDRGADPRARHEAPRGHRLAPHEPQRRRLGLPRRSEEARRMRRSSSARRSSRPTTSSSRTRSKIEAVADTVLEEKEIYGDDLVRLLDEQNFKRPVIDWTDESVWPKFMNWSKFDPKDDKDKSAGSAVEAAPH